MAVESTIFKKNVLSQNLDTDPSNLIISSFYTLWTPFSPQTQKHSILCHLCHFIIYLKFQVNLAEVSLDINSMEISVFLT